MEYTVSRKPVGSAAIPWLSRLLRISSAEARLVLKRTVSGRSLRKEAAICSAFSFP